MKKTSPRQGRRKVEAEPELLGWPKPGPYALAAIALALFYLATMSGHLMSMDGLYMERQATALVFDHSVRFRTPLWTWRTEPTWNSLYGIGLSLLYIPGLLVAAPLAAQVPASVSPPHNRYAFYLQELYQDPLYAVGGSWLHPLIAAVSAYLVARLVLALGFGRRAALWAMAFYGLGSSAAAYARGDFAQPLEGLCWIAAMLASVQYASSASRGTLAAGAAAIFYAILTRPVEGAMLAPAALALMLSNAAGAARRRWLEPIGAVVLAGAAGVGLTLLVNLGRTGNPFDFGYPEGNTWQVPELLRWLAVIVSPGRGVLWEFPALVFVPLGAAALRRSGRTRDAACILGLAAALFVNVTAWAAWWGGWCWGLRLFGPAIPLLAVLAGIGAAELDRTRAWLATVAVVLGFAWSLPCIVTDILGGYGALTEGVPNGWHWKLSAYPPLGAWRFLTHVFARSATDPSAVDILWFRLAPITGYWTLAVPAVLIALALVLVRRVAKESDA